MKYLLLWEEYGADGVPFLATIENHLETGNIFFDTEEDAQVYAIDYARRCVAEGAYVVAKVGRRFPTREEK